MGLTVGQTAAHRGADPHGHRWVDAVNIETDMDVIRFSHQSVQHLAFDTLDSYAVDVRHRVKGKAHVAHGLLFQPIDTAQADQRTVLRCHLGGETHDVRQRKSPQAERYRHRHAVDVSRWRGGIQVHVGMGIDPDNPRRFAVFQSVGCQPAMVPMAMEWSPPMTMGN